MSIRRVIRFGALLILAALVLAWTTDPGQAQGEPTAGTPQAGPMSADWKAGALDLANKRDWNGLLDYTQRWTRAQPGESQAWEYLGYASEALGQHAQAAQAYQQVVHIKPDYVGAWNNLASAYDELGQYGEAEQAAQSALRLKPDDPGALNSLGLAYNGLGQGPRAREAYQHALQAKPDFAAAWYNLGALYQKQNDIVRSRAVYERLKDLDPAMAQSYKKNVIGAR